LVETGLARFEYRHIINHGLPSEMAALATECAGDQDAWWEVHDYYFAGPSRDAYTRDGAVAVAAELGLDTDEFAQCIDDRVHIDQIYEQHTDAVTRGLASTPTVLVNGERGPTSADALIELVKELAEG
jgi:protein-disulfide isomerase